MRWLGILAALIAVGAAPAAAVADPPTALPATVKPLEAQVDEASYASLDLRTGTSGMTGWRVIEGTGNCCEHYLAVTAQGRLIDFGGTTLNFSDDGGQTWSAVAPAGPPLLGGEGAVGVAPDGTILGIGWDVYSGDQLFALRFDPKANTWTSNRLPVHAPFYDREWIAVLPGPWNFGGDERPWLAMFRGGTANKDPWFVSADGLDYSTVAVQSSATATQTTWPPVVADPGNERTQPLARTGATPLGHGAVMAQPQLASEYGVAADGALAWSRLAQPDGSTPKGDVIADNRGWLHAIVERDKHLTFRTSTDQGRTWQETALPFAGTAEAWDLKVDSALGLGAVALHGHNDLSGTDADYVYKLDVSTPVPSVYKRYAIGAGDLTAGDNVSSTGARFDFGSLVILPDGRVATSFFDASTANSGPRVAVELSPELPPRAGAPAAGAPAPAAASTGNGSLSRPPSGGEAALAPAPRGGLRITVKARRRGARTTISGRVRPVVNAIVRVERRRGRRWVSDRLTALSDAGTFRAVVRGRGVFRVSLGGAHSRTVRVR